MHAACPAAATLIRTPTPCTRLRVPVHLLHVRLPAVHKQQLRRQVLWCQRVALRGERRLLLCKGKSGWGWQRDESLYRNPGRVATCAHAAWSQSDHSTMARPLCKGCPGTHPGLAPAPGPTPPAGCLPRWWQAWRTRRGTTPRSSPGRCTESSGWQGLWSQRLIKVPAWDSRAKQWSGGRSKQLQQSVSVQKVQR